MSRHRWGLLGLVGTVAAVAVAAPAYAVSSNNGPRTPPVSDSFITSKPSKAAPAAYGGGSDLTSTTPTVTMGAITDSPVTQADINAANQEDIDDPTHDPSYEQYANSPVRCKAVHVDQTWHTKAAGDITQRNNTRWCYRWAYHTYFRLTSGWTSIPALAALWDYTDLGWFKNYVNPTHTRIQTRAHTKFFLNDPGTGARLDTITADLCLTVDARGEAWVSCHN
jgi:hypothetical protein